MSFFRPTGTGPMVLGPGDTYTFLALTAETDGAYFVLEGLVPPDLARPLTSTTIRPRPSISLKVS